MTGLEARAHALMLAVFHVLMAMSLWLIWIALPGTGPGRAIFAVLLTLPLAAPLPGLWRRHRTTAVWASFVLTPYLAVALMEVVANPAAWWPASLVILLCLLALVSLVAWLRISRLQRSL